DPGSVRRYLPTLPVGDYPRTLEVLLAWGAAMTRSFAFTGPLMVGFAAMVAAAAWVGGRALRVPRLATGLAAALLVMTSFPEINGVWTDLPSLAWLLCAAALAAAARRRPAQLAPALVAAGLAVGTKTTALPLATAALLAGGVVAGRADLRAHAPALLAAAALAAVAGGLWYVRNLAVHGSP